MTEELTDYSKKYTFGKTGKLHGQGHFRITYLDGSHNDKAYYITGTALVRKLRAEKLTIPDKLKEYVKMVDGEDNIPEPIEKEVNNIYININAEALWKLDKKEEEKEEYEYIKKFTFIDSEYQHAEGIFYIKYINDNNKTFSISGTNLVRKFQQENLKIPPSLNYFVELVRKQDNPTAEELEEKRIRQDNQRKALEQEKIEKNKLNDIILKQKASSRLEKLKEQNSISK